MANQQKPLLAITMGDPAGCGPEIVAKVAASGAVDDDARLVCVGDANVIEKAIAAIGGSLSVCRVQDLEQVAFVPRCLVVLDLHNVDLATLQVGKVQSAGGQAAYEYVTRAIDLALQGQVDGVVTAPLNKEALHLAGHNYDGHTEIFAIRTQTPKVVMMLASEGFRVTHVSTHCSLKDAIERCRTQRVLDVIRISHQALCQMGMEHPRIAVAGLNPHSGEGGLFGSEEIEQIQPAIDQACGEGMKVYPYPVPPDTVFVRMVQNREFDLVVAQYHDQGHIAAKLVDFWGGVNISLGLPIIRTSVDHGTAFEVAYTGNANPSSLINAIRYAQVMARYRKGY